MNGKIIFTSEGKIVFVQPDSTLKDLSGNFVLSVQETLKFPNQSVIVLVNAKNERLFMRRGPTDSYGTELIPLSDSELKKFNIVQETCQNRKYFVQETAREEEEDGKKKKAEFDITDPESMRKAKEFAEQQLEHLEGSEEVQDLQEKLRLAAEINLRDKLKLHGMDRSSFSTDQEAIDALHEAQQSAPEGGTFAPLSGQTENYRPASNDGGYTGTTKDEATQAMIHDLYRQSRNGKDLAKQAEAQALLKELWLKWSKEMRKNVEDPSKNSCKAGQYESKTKGSDTK